MKKLLIILLLLFPIHGAWADNVISLICTYDTIYSADGQSNINRQIPYQINLTKKLFKDWPVQITQNTIQLNTISNKANKSVVKKTIIDRTTGGVSTEISEETTFVQAFENLHTNALPQGAVLFGSCEKTSGKNKF